MITIATAPAELDITVYQGAYWSQAILWQDSSEVPVDLTGYTARMQVRRKVDSDDVIIELTTDPAPGGGAGNGRITLGPGDGEILLEIEATATDDLPATPFDRKWRYDLEMVPAGGQVRRLAMGKFVVSLEVTRP